MIQLTHLVKKFGERLAVDDLSLQVSRGEIYGLLGHNGAGKSTAIGMMLGQVWPTAGEARVCGHDVTANRSEALRKVGAIFETPAFYEYLSGWRNLEILSSYSAPTRRTRLAEVIDWVGLSGREHSKVRTYSHGMRSRLALAQALLPGPELLILDEPSDGLDPEGIHEMRQTILRLRRELGLTILLSSHFLSEVEQLCTRIAVLKQGRILFEGPLQEVRQRSQWVRLKVGDFKKAVEVLRRAKLIIDSDHTPKRDQYSKEYTSSERASLRSASEEGNGQHVILAENVETDHVVRSLVQQEISVFEIAREEETLETFYLRLMK